MPKTKVKLDVRLPPYPEPKRGTGRPGMAWRRDLHEAIAKASAKQGIKQYAGTDLECDVILYMTKGQLDFHDVDNLLKHIFDAMQGRLGGTKAKVQVDAILPNDHQIKRVRVEKREARTKKLVSRLIVRDYAKSRRRYLRQPTHD